MKKLSFIFFILLFTIFQTQSQTISVSGVISSDNIWDVDTVFLVDELIIDTNATLYINSGTSIVSLGYQGIKVFGSIIAIGDQGSPIIFTAKDIDNFDDTTSNAGGWDGIYFKSDSYLNEHESVFENCEFKYGKNVTPYDSTVNGGIINAKKYNTLIFRNCYFWNNMVFTTSNYCSVGNGGGIYVDSVYSIEIVDCLFEKNRSTGGGGCVFVGKSKKTIISNNIFRENKSIKYTSPLGYCGSGVAVCCTEAFDAVYSPQIYNNLCYNNFTLSGVIYTSNLNAKVFNNIICNNKGTGIFDGHELSTSYFFNNTIVNNQGSGICLFSNANVYNNICWSNIDFWSPDNDQIEIFHYPNLFNNCVQYGEGGDSAIYEMPTFINPTTKIGIIDNYSADWSLTDNSTCVNQGVKDTSGLFIPDFDFNNEQRVFGNRIDIGAIENQNVVVREEIDLPRFKIYPNPGCDFIKVEYNNSDFQFYLYNVKGEVVYTDKIYNEKEINLMFLKSGIYLYKIIPNNNKQFSGIWIKK